MSKANEKNNGHITSKAQGVDGSFRFFGMQGVLECHRIIIVTMNPRVHESAINVTGLTRLDENQASTSRRTKATYLLYCTSKGNGTKDKEGDPY
jgi:hypothetical protein